MRGSEPLGSVVGNAMRARRKPESDEFRPDTEVHARWNVLLWFTDFAFPLLGVDLPPFVRGMHGTYFVVHIGDKTNWVSGTISQV